MPKVIPKLRDKIIKVASNSFIEYGYDGLSIRALAKSVGIATGTLYNYFPNKLTLFQSILMDSWDKTLLEIEKITVEGRDTTLIQVIELLFRDIEERGGFTHTILSSMEKSREELKKITEYSHTTVIDKLHTSLIPMGLPFDSNDGLRYTQMLIGTIRTMLVYRGDSERSSNIRFLYSLLKREIKEPIE